MPSKVFTYGSLMYPEVWNRVVAGRYQHEPAVVAGFRRYAIDGETYPGAQANADAILHGVLYHEVEEADLLRLDAFEGADYQRITVQATPVAAPGRGACGAKPLQASLYVYTRTSRLLCREWSVADFEREGLARFLSSRPWMP
jgi:gamma-glutamylcyclotransferase (GGCT)/AIG2-like uncharacterized protein YtfP